MADRNYVNFTVSRLKQELSRRGAVTSGRKNDLIERLDAYDRNFNFHTDMILLPDEIVPNWPASGFKQINTAHRNEIPDIIEEQITGYFQYRIASDYEMSGDLKSMEKGRLLLESGRVVACSYQITNTATFFTGIVRAAMKKKVSYNYKLKINSESGEVINSDCECPAGKGPHATCKHIATVLLMLVEFRKSGELKVGKTCTDTLQTFHRPKRSYVGSPVKAENLPCKKEQSLMIPDLLSTATVQDIMTMLKI